MNENHLAKASLYEPQRPPKIRNKMRFLAAVLAALLAVHFLNIFLHWTVIRKELAQAPVFNSPEYTFFGFAAFNRERISTVRYFKNSSQPARVFAYFDSWHPAVFAVWNKEDMTFVDLGPVIVSLPSGFSRVSLFPGPGFSIEHENKMALKSHSASYGGAWWYRLLAEKLRTSKSNLGELRNVSFVVKELEDTRFCKIPYMAYFYLPLLVIVFLAVRHGAAFLTAMFYYVGMFFLFDFRAMFVAVPFDWLFKLLKWEVDAGLVEAAAIGLFTIFAGCAVFGLWHWRRSRLTGAHKGIILFFSLLPLFLFL
jgi:hypothetical protein